MGLSANGQKRTCLSSSFISESERLQHKLKLQDKGQVDLIIDEIGSFLIVTILNSPGN